MNKILKNSIPLLIIIIALSACKTDYLTDGGIAKAETKMTAYDYLKNNKYNMFDSLLVLIDTLKLKDTINATGTFFASTDYSIALFLKRKTTFLQAKYKDTNKDTVYTFKAMLSDPDTKPSFILQYAFKDKITLKNATITEKDYTSLANTVISVEKTKTTDGNYYKYSDEPVYFLYYNRKGYEKEVCQTTDVLTQNGKGTILNVLNDGHYFDLFTPGK